VSSSLGVTKTVTKLNEAGVAPDALTFDGNDTYTVSNGSSGNIAYVKGSSTTIATSFLDTITGFTTGDKLVMPFQPTAVATTLGSVSGTTIGLIAGTYSATAGTFIIGSGSDRLFVYDTDGVGADDIEGIVLIGGVSSTTGLTAASGVTGFVGG